MPNLIFASRRPSQPPSLTRTSPPRIQYSPYIVINNNSMRSIKGQCSTLNVSCVIQCLYPPPNGSCSPPNNSGEHCVNVAGMCICETESECGACCTDNPNCVKMGDDCYCP